MQVDLHRTDINEHFFTDTDGTKYRITGPNQATEVGGTRTITPQFIRSAADSVSARQWDTEQIIVGTPGGERIVAEGRAGNRAAGGDQEANIFNVALTSPPMAPAFQGNLNPGVTTSNVSNSNFSISSGAILNFNISYTASNQTLTMTWTDNGGNTIGSTMTGVLQTGAGLSDIALRVNVAAHNEASRSLTLSGLEISTNGGAFNDLSRNFDGTTSNTIASVASQGLGQRQFASWTNVISETEDFQVKGSAEYDWSGADPSASQIAFQFKFGDAITRIPEPSTYALGFGVLALGIALRRRYLIRKKQLKTA